MSHYGAQNQASHRGKEQPISVYDPHNNHMSNCTKRLAAKMVSRGKAKWIGYNQVQLLITQEDEKRIRREVRKVYGLTCYICGEELSIDTTSYDHIIPRSRGGEDSVENLRPCCVPCNKDKANRTLEEYCLVVYARNLLMYDRIRRASMNHLDTDKPIYAKRDIKVFGGDYEPIRKGERISFTTCRLDREINERVYMVQVDHPGAGIQMEVWEDDLTNDASASK